MSRAGANDRTIAASSGRPARQWDVLCAAAVRFFVAPASPLPCGVLRIGLGLLLITQALAIAGHLFDFYGSLGLVQTPIIDVLAWPLTPRVAWVVRALAPLGIGESAAIRLVFVAHLLSALAFLVGWRTRLATVVVWVTNLTLTTSAAPHLYGFDMFLKIALFYCVFAPVGCALSWDVVAGRSSSRPSFAARLSLRVLQAHLAVAYAATGIEKASGLQWWNGEALWRALMRADLGTVDFSWMAWTPWIAALACWVTVVVEIGYAIFIWPRRTRKWCALAIIVMHVGIALTLGLAAFSAIMILLTFCAWLVPCEPPSARAARQTGFVVAYDGSCSICRQVVGLALGVSRRAFVPVGRNHGRRVPALGNCDGLEQMMAVTRDGRIRAGADAFFVMWAHALGWPRVQILARLAPVRAGYFLFASHRHRLGCHGRCSVSARVTRAA